MNFGECKIFGAGTKLSILKCYYLNRIFTQEILDAKDYSSLLNLLKEKFEIKDLSTLEGIQKGIYSVYLDHIYKLIPYGDQCIERICCCFLYYFDIENIKYLCNLIHYSDLPHPDKKILFNTYHKGLINQEKLMNIKNFSDLIDILKGTFLYKIMVSSIRRYRNEMDITNLLENIESGYFSFFREVLLENVEHAYRKDILFICDLPFILRDLRDNFLRKEVVPDDKSVGNFLNSSLLRFKIKVPQFKRYRDYELFLYSVGVERLLKVISSELFSYARFIAYLWLLKRLIEECITFVEGFYLKIEKKRILSQTPLFSILSK